MIWQDGQTLLQPASGFPDRPDPAKSRRIAEGRLVASCFIALAVFYHRRSHRHPGNGNRSRQRKSTPLAGTAERGRSSIAAAG